MSDENDKHASITINKYIVCSKVVQGSYILLYTKINSRVHSAE